MNLDTVHVVKRSHHGLKSGRNSSCFVLKITEVPHAWTAIFDQEFLDHGLQLVYLEVYA